MATVKMASTIAGSAMAESVISRLLPMPPKALAGSRPPSARKNLPSASNPTSANAPPNKPIGARAMTIGTISPASSAVRNMTYGANENTQDACSEMTMSLRRNLTRSK